MNQTLEQPRKNLICNFRAPNEEKFQKWEAFKDWCKDNGLDICNVTLNITQAFMTGTAKFLMPDKAIQINMANKFYYEVVKPRRLPFSTIGVKEAFRNTIKSSVWDAYIIERARRLNTEFSFHDFKELEYSMFRRIIARLKRNGLLMANPLRTIPQFYILTERLEGAKL